MLLHGAKDDANQNLKTLVEQVNGCRGCEDAAVCVGALRTAYEQACGTAKEYARQLITSGKYPQAAKLVQLN